MRDKTHASHKLEDDVHQEEKMRRLQEVLYFPPSSSPLSLHPLHGQVITTFRTAMIEKNQKEVNRYQLVLVEGDAKKSTPSHRTLTGRSDGNKRCVFAANEISILQNLPLSSAPPAVALSADVAPRSLPLDDHVQALLSQYLAQHQSQQQERQQQQEQRIPRPGDYVVFLTEEAKGQTLYGKAVAITTLMDFHSLTSTCPASASTSAP
jgi:hypothetical protein